MRFVLPPSVGLDMRNNKLDLVMGGLGVACSLLSVFFRLNGDKFEIKRRPPGVAFCRLSKRKWMSVYIVVKWP